MRLGAGHRRWPIEPGSATAPRKAFQSLGERRGDVSIPDCVLPDGRVQMHRAGEGNGILEPYAVRGWCQYYKSWFCCWWSRPRSRCWPPGSRSRRPFSLVLTGVVLALVPGLPSVRLAPEFVLLLVLPPVIYSSAVAMSWREFRFNLRPISLLAVGCVLFTTLATAAAMHWFLGLSWPVGFVIGAIVSPPDAVAPLSIARRMQLRGAS